MKRRSRAGGEPIKGRRRKAPEPKRRNAPKAIARSNSSPNAAGDGGRSAYPRTERGAGAAGRDVGGASGYQRLTGRSSAGVSSHAGERRRASATLSLEISTVGTATPCTCRDAQCARRLRRSSQALTVPSRSENSYRPHDCEQNGGSCRRSCVQRKPTLERDPCIVAARRTWRRAHVLMVPMLKENELIGAFSRVPPRSSSLHRQTDCTGHRTSPLKPSSPSRTRGCSTNCASAPPTSPSAPPTSPKR